MRVEFPNGAETPFHPLVREALREELFRHRDEVAEYDLSRFEGEKPRTVKVEFGAPTEEAVARVVDKLAVESPLIIPPGHDVSHQVFGDIANALLAEWEQEQWQLSRTEGSVTVEFSEVPRGAEHPANPAVDARTHGNLAVQYMDSAGESAFVAVDGRALRYMDKNVLKQSLPSVVQWVDAVKTAERDGVLDFAPVVTLTDGLDMGGTKDNAAIYPPNVVMIGGKFLHDINDLEVKTNIMRHERGHAVNGDLDTNNPQHAVFIEKLWSIRGMRDVLMLLDIMSESKSDYAQWLADTDLSHEDALQVLRRLEEAVDTVDLQAAKVLAHVKNYPWYDELDGMAVAADYDNKTSFLAHMKDGPALDAEPFMAAYDEFAGSTQSSQHKEVPPEEKARRVEELEDAFTAIADRPALYAKLEELDTAFQAVSQAREYRADLHAVQFAENPGRVHRVFETFKTIGVRPNGDQGSHPHVDDRIGMSKHFAERIQHRREQDKVEAGNRPR